jgi:hypothetical protein
VANKLFIQTITLNKMTSKKSPHLPSAKPAVAIHKANPPTVTKTNKPLVVTKQLLVDTDDTKGADNLKDSWDFNNGVLMRLRKKPAVHHDRNSSSESNLNANVDLRDSSSSAFDYTTGSYVDDGLIGDDKSHANSLTSPRAYKSSETSLLIQVAQRDMQTSRDISNDDDGKILVEDKHGWEAFEDKFTKKNVLVHRKTGWIKWPETEEKRDGSPNEAPLSPTASSKDSVPVLEKRVAVLKELIETEISYLNLMNIMVEEHWAVMLSERDRFKEMSDPRVVLMYQNVREIMCVNAVFLQELTSLGVEYVSVKNVDNILEKLTDVLRDFGYYFKVYGQFGQNYAIGMEVVSRLMKSKKEFKHVMDQCSKRPRCQRNTFESFMIMPIQRLPRYCLLVKDLLKTFGKDEKMHSKLEEALATLEGSAQYLNEMIKEREAREKLVFLEKFFSTETYLLKRGRKLVRSGTLVRYGKGGEQETVFFLFTDILVYAVEKSDDVLTEKFRILMHDVVSCQADDELSFVLKSREKSFLVSAHSKAVRDSWVADINKCMQESRPTKPLTSADGKFIAPVVSNNRDRCYICKSVFILRRRHFCARW